MNYCGTCSNLRIGDYPTHEALSMYRCRITGKFYTLTKPTDCRKHVLTDDIEARRELVRRNK